MSRQSGMSVIELMVGLGLMAVAVMGLNSLSITATRYNLSARLIDQATHLAQQKIEDIKRNGYAAAAPGTTVESSLNADGTPGGGFQRQTVIAAGAIPNTRTVTVTITWTDYGIRQTNFFTQIVDGAAWGGGGGDDDDDDDDDDEEDDDDDDHGGDDDDHGHDDDDHGHDDDDHGHDDD